MKLKVRFNHFHNGNDPDHNVRGSAIYATMATLVDVETGKSITTVVSYCNPKDVPTRKLGRQYALERLTHQVSGCYGLMTRETITRVQDAVDQAKNMHQQPRSSLAALI